MMKTEKTIRVGVVGIGHLGTYHLQKYAKIDGCDITAVSDTAPERAAKAASSTACEAFADHRNLLGKVDAVSIAVPTGFHHAVARDSSRRAWMCSLKSRFAPPWRKRTICSRFRREGLRVPGRFRGALQPGRNGPRKSDHAAGLHRSPPAASVFERGTDVDVILDLMIHDLDIILKFVRSPLTLRRSGGRSVLSDKIDISNVRLSFASGCIANVTASRISAKTMQKLRSSGRKATTPWTPASAKSCRSAGPPGPDGKQQNRPKQYRQSATTIRWKRRCGPLSPACGRAPPDRNRARKAEGRLRWPKKFYAK
jgi:predicted dehydrogenase